MRRICTWTGAWTMVIALLVFLSGSMALAETKREDNSSNLLLWTAGATTLSFVLLDEEIQEFSQRNILGIEDKGTIVQHSFTAMLPIFAVMGYLGDDIKAQLTTRALLRGIVVNTVVTAASKEVIGRKRPSRWEGAYEFEPFSGNRSFPSGHTSHSFTVATVMSEVYGEEHRWVPVISYGAASFVAYSRIDGNKHWVSDVIVGAAMGHLIGKWAVSAEERKMAITPIVFNNGGVGLQAKFRF